MKELSIPSSLPGWINDHLQRYLATNGEDGYWWDAKFGGGQGMVPTLLLTTTGRKSGKPLTLPLIFGMSGSSYVVVASKGGAPEHPSWYLNLQNNPTVQVQVKADRFAARARTIQGPSRQQVWDQMVKLYGPYADYQKKTSREIPLVALDRA
jgi:deazaflavin-dependent oxidoreductase (nitroreductase family)